MSSYIIPFFIIFILLYCLYKKINAYDAFVNGSKTSFELILTSLPYIVAIFIALEVFSKSGLSDFIATLISPVLGFLGIPSELTEMILIKPFSGCGSLAVLENIFSTYGVDSYLARAGCAIAGSSEAVFYITAVYFSKTDIKHFRYAIPVSLIANLIGAVVGCWICRFI